MPVMASAADSLQQEGLDFIAVVFTGGDVIPDQSWTMQQHLNRLQGALDNALLMKPRFLNLLADIGDKVVVILSTHIVEDVADLCPAMAIIANGRIIRQGAPHELMHELEGRIWRKTIDRAELEPLKMRLQVISTRLVSGRTVVHVLADNDPGEGFTPHLGGLEDVYFTALAASRRAA